MDLPHWAIALGWETRGKPLAVWLAHDEILQDFHMKKALQY